MGKRFPSYERKTTPDLAEEVKERGRGRFSKGAEDEEIDTDAGRDILGKETDAAVASRIEKNAPGGRRSA